MNEEREPSERPEADDQDAGKPTHALVIPRPSEVHPLNAVTGTPPPVDVIEDLTETELAALVVEADRPSTEPVTRSSAPPERISLVPHSRLTTTLSASLTPSLGARTHRRSSAPSPSRAAPPETEVARPSVPTEALSTEAPSAEAPSTEANRSSSKAPRPSFTPTQSQPPSLTVTAPTTAPSVGPGRASTPATPQVPSPSFRPSGLGRLNTSVPPSSLKAKALRPTSMPPILDKVALVNEEPSACEANETLQTNGLRDVFRERAQSALAHANTLNDPAQKARYYVLASELYAMIGLPQTARLLAENAAKLGNHLGHRQVRQLAQATGDDKTASAAFASEITSAPTPDVRRHVATTGTHFERWVRKDALAATRNSELLQRLVPQDPGPHLLKLARQLGQNNTPPPNQTWHPEVHRQLISANVSLQKLRGDMQRITDDCKDPAATFLEVRAALERRDRVAAAKGLLNLRHQKGYERPVVWLAALLLSPVAATRDKAIELFAELDAAQSTKSLRRVLAAQAVEAGNTELLAKVVAADANQEAGEKAFDMADQLAFVALGLRPVDLEPLAKAADNDNVRPLFRALAHAHNAVHLLTVNDTSRADGTKDAVARERTGSDAVLDRLQELDAACTRADSAAIARSVMSLTDLESTENLSFVAATATAGDGFTEDTKDWLTHALSSPVCGEAALYTLLPNCPREAAPELLQSLANVTTAPDHKALLLGHAALTATNNAEQIRLSVAAFTADPSHPLVEAVTQRYCAAKLDPNVEAREGSTPGTSDPPSSRPRLLHQLVNISNAQSVSGRSAFERALALSRQALRSPAGTTRDTLLAHARELLPEDVTLLDLLEATSNPSAAARARAREQLLTRVNGVESQAALRTEAALLYEISGQFSDAARVSQHAITTDDVWQWCFERNAPGTEFASALRKRVVERASTATQQTERASGWLQAARLASDAGDWSAEQSAIDNALRLDPNHVEGLLAAEALAFKEGEPDRIAEVESLMAEAFPAPDSVAHARFAVRFLQARGGSSAGYTLLLECAESGTPSLDVARRLTYLAPRMGDDEMAFNMVQHLLPPTTNPLDRAILALHAANLAFKLGRTELALSHVEQSLQAHADYIPALSLRAQLLAASELHAQAAEAFERLASTARSPLLGGIAFKRAAEHLLKEAPTLGLSSAGSSDVTSSSNGISSNNISSNSIVDLARLRINLERALSLLPDDPWLFERLVQAYTTENLQEPLSELFTRRLANATPEQRTTLGLRFARACHAVGAAERALELVDEVLVASPDDEEALTLLAQLARTDAEREKTLLQLVRVASNATQQASAYKQLGKFYRTQAPQALRAAKSFQEVLKRDPTDSEAVRALVELQVANADFTAAEQTIATYGERTKTPAAQHLVAVLSAVVAGARDPDNGISLLEGLLAQRPFDETALSELAGLYVRTGRSDQLKALVRRTRDFALQQIPVGDQLIEGLKCVAHLAGLTSETSELLLVRATFNLYHGVDTGLDARGSRALSKALDDVLAPPPLNSAVRSFLAQTADLLTPAVKPSEESKVTDKRIRAAFEMKARAASIQVPELYTSEKDPYSCVVLHNPPRIVLGTTWIREAPQNVLDFLAWRCLKTVQAGVGAFVHLTNQDALLYIDAVLRHYVDTQDVLVASEDRLDGQGLLRPERESGPKGSALDVLATQVLEQLVQSELEFADALRLWVNRSALLATGEPRTGLQYIALSSGERNPNTTGDAIAFAARNAEARHLLRSMLDEGVAVAHRTIH